MKVIWGLRPMLQVGFFFAELTCCGKNKVVAREIRILKMSPRAFVVPADTLFLLIFRMPGPFLCTFSTLGKWAVGPAPQAARLEEQVLSTCSTWDTSLCADQITPPGKCCYLENITLEDRYLKNEHAIGWEQWKWTRVIMEKLEERTNIPVTGERILVSIKRQCYPS